MNAQSDRAKRASATATALRKAAIAGLRRSRASARSLASVSVFAAVAGVTAIVFIAVAAGTTTTLASATYNYDRAAPNAQGAQASLPRVADRMGAPSPTDGARRSGRARSVNFLATKSGPRSVGALERNRFEPSPKHPDLPEDAANAALDYSIELPGKTTRRVGVDYDNGRFVVFDETYPGRRVFHGHYRDWRGLNPKMQSALRKHGMVDKRGRITVGSGG